MNTTHMLGKHWKWGLLAVLAIMALVTVTLAWPRPGPATATGGNSITSPDMAGSQGIYTSLALDTSGNPVVSYQGNTDLKVLHCDDVDCFGNEIGNITNVDNVGNVGLHTSLALDTSGNPVVSYYDNTNGDLKLLHCDDANCTSRNITSPDTSGDVGSHTSLALDASGNPVISYYDATSGNLKVLHCDDPNCAGDESSNTAALDTTGDVGSHTSLELDDSDNPVVSYHDASNGNLKVVHCDDANCTSGKITTPDASGDVGSHTSLELDDGDNPVVSYYDASNGNLKVVHCDDANCSGDESSNITSPDTDGDVGEFTSLALDGGGYPVVSYYDSTNRDLKVLHCGNANCTAGNSITAPDAVGDVGRYTSLALDASGNPVVSYYDCGVFEPEDGCSSGDLKVLHCGDANCAVGSSQINITNLGQYALPKTCFEVFDDQQASLFGVCDNGFVIPSGPHAVCNADGTPECEDADPAEGSIRLVLDPGVYNVVFLTGAEYHTPDPSKQECATGPKCELTFTHTSITRPWHPWDFDGDGRVRISDVLAVIAHYRDDKPLPTPMPTP